MPLRNAAIAAAVLIGAAAAAAYGITTREGEYPQATPSGVSARTWRPVGDAQPVQFPAVGDQLLRPLSVQEGPGGTLYVMDFGDMKIKQFSPQGALLRTYGRGTGRGPGEMLNPTDFHVAANGEVRVLDPAQGRIQFFDAAGQPTRTVKLEVPALRFAVHGDGRWTAFGNRDLLFHTFTATGELVDDFGRLVPDQLRRAVALQGEIEPTPDGGIVYAPLRGGYLARFSPAGELVYYRETVQPNPYPDIMERESDGGRMVTKEQRETLSTVSASVQGDSLFALTVAMVDGKRRGVIDVYDLATGAYSYSFVSPQRGPQSIHVTPTHLYVTSETVVTAWPRATLLKQ